MIKFETKSELFFVTFIILLPFIAHAQPVQKFAQLGDFKLESGKVINKSIYLNL